MPYPICVYFLFLQFIFGLAVLKQPNCLVSKKENENRLLEFSTFKSPSIQFTTINDSSGLVGITGACATVDTEWALFIGMVSGLIYFSLTKVFLNRELTVIVNRLAKICGFSWKMENGIFFKLERQRAKSVSSINSCKRKCIKSNK